MLDVAKRSADGDSGRACEWALIFIEAAIVFILAVATLGPLILH